MAGERVAEVQRQVLFVGRGGLELLGGNMQAAEKKVGERSPKGVSKGQVSVRTGPRTQGCRVMKRGMVSA